MKTTHNICNHMDAYWRNPVAILLSIIFSLSLACGGDEGDGLGVELPTGGGDFITSINGVDISGTLFLPEGNGPFPVMVIVPGSGNQPKETAYPFKDIFLPDGFAIYFYDKRGIGKSTGSYPIETIENPMDFLNARRDDVLSIVEMLATHTDIRKDQIGLSGSSQGAWVNALVYEASSEIDFIMMSVGGATPTGIENYYDGLMNDPNLSIEVATAMLYDYTGTLGFNPRSIVSSMSIPVSWVFGAKDRSHPTFYDIGILEELDKSNFSIYVFENSNHDMLDVNTGQFESQLFPTLLSWMAENAR